MIRREIKVSEYYGKSPSAELKARESLLHAEEDFKKAYNSLNREEKRKLSKEVGLAEARKLAASAKQSVGMEDSLMLLATHNDKPMSLNQFLVKIKDNFNSNLYVEPNLLVGGNVGGHAVRFRHVGTENGWLPVCGVGKSGEFVIKPETEFQEVFNGEKNERKIRSRGYLGAYKTIAAFLETNHFSIKNPSFAKL